MAKYEEEMKTFNNQISCVIIEAFPQFSLDQVEDWSIEKTLWYYSRAKWILETLRGITLERESTQPEGTNVNGTQVVGDRRDFPELDIM